MQRFYLTLSSNHIHDERDTSSRFKSFVTLEILPSPCMFLIVGWHTPPHRDQNPPKLVPTSTKCRMTCRKPGCPLAGSHHLLRASAICLSSWFPSCQCPQLKAEYASSCSGGSPRPDLRSWLHFKQRVPASESGPSLRCLPSTAAL